MTLNELYKEKLKDYKETGKREQPDKLLAMLLLPERDYYEPLMVAEGVFYQSYQKEIDEKIDKVIQDFDITTNEIVQMVESKGVLCENFEHNKIWFVFAKGFGAMHWGLMYHKEMSPEEIYEECFEPISEKGIARQKKSESKK